MYNNTGNENLQEQRQDFKWILSQEQEDQWDRLKLIRKLDFGRLHLVRDGFYRELILPAKEF